MKVYRDGDILVIDVTGACWGVWSCLALEYYVIYNDGSSILLDSPARRHYYRIKIEPNNPPVAVVEKYVSSRGNYYNSVYILDLTKTANIEKEIIYLSPWTDYEDISNKLEELEKLVSREAFEGILRHLPISRSDGEYIICIDTRLPDKPCARIERRPSKN